MIEPLWLSLSGFGLAAVTAALAPNRVRLSAGGVLTAASGAAAVWAGIAALLGHRVAAELPGLPPLSGLRIELDPLGGFFVAVTGAVTVCCAVYGIGYRHGDAATRVPQTLLPLFAAAMLLVPAAASVTTLLAAWELMALLSLLLVLTEHRRRDAVRRAGLWYAVLTHLGFVAIATGLFAFAAAANGETFAALRAAEPSTAVATLVFCASFGGFASKAGMIPLHVWLPRAHPEAPSHVSALMSAAMVNLGVYGILRVGLDLLGGGPRWWWLLVLAVGAASALYGILQAAVTADLKRLLGHSTTENLGIVLIGVGAGGFFAAGGATDLAALAITAALLHLVNHAAFKTLLFGAAGSVLHATGTRDLDALGGLRTRMPATTALFGLGALCAAALPPGNGFVGEWLLLQSLVHSLSDGGVAAAVTMPLAVGVIALSAGLAVATFVKAFGTGFLAKPRGFGAAEAVESPPTMLAGMGLAALACVGLALAPGLVLPGLSKVTAAVLSDADTAARATGLRLSAAASSLSPLIIVAALAVAVAGVLVAVRAFGSRRRRAARPWDCGAGPTTERMEYTATSFAEPLQRVFDDVLAPESDVDVTPTRESAYLVAKVAVTRAVPDRIEARLYLPLLRLGRRLGRRARGLADGSVHRYLTYGFVSLLALLVYLAVSR